MSLDFEGFSYPSVNTNMCINCHACEKVCPYNFSRGNKKNESLFCAIQHKDEKIRRQSTAGGFFSLIAETIIDRGGVVYAAGYDNSVKVCHKRAETKDQIQEMCGSKYVQSDLENCFRQIHDDVMKGTDVLFVGTPCQTNGLMNYIGENSHLYTIDLLCLGVSSPGLFAKYIEYLNNKYKKVRSVQFRNKQYGYGVPNVRVCFDDGDYLEQKYDSMVHANLFFKHYYNARLSCYQCKFRSAPRVSDFTIGDFKNIGKYSEEFDDDKGTTRLWIHTGKGLQLFEQSAGNVKYLKLDENVENIVDGPEQKYPIPADRNAFFQDAHDLSYQKFVAKWEPNTLKYSVIGFIRPILARSPFGRKLLKSIRRK